MNLYGTLVILYGQFMGWFVTIWDGAVRCGIARYVGEIARSRYGVVRHDMGWYGSLCEFTVRW